jgi:hypothetical protein
LYPFNPLNFAPILYKLSAIMSMFGLGRPQPSSAEKIAAAEQEMDLVTDMFNKYVFPFPLPQATIFTTELQANAS